MTPQEFKDFREHLDLTQSQLSSYLGVTRESVARYENGDRAITRTVELAMRMLVTYRDRQINYPPEGLVTLLQPAPENPMLELASALAKKHAEKTPYDNSVAIEKLQQQIDRINKHLGI